MYYQPEPTLLTIASGEQGIVEEQQVGGRQHQYPIENELLMHDSQPKQNFPHERHQVHGRSRTVEPPPPWIPDSMAPQCMGCGQVDSFSIFHS